MKDKYFRFLGKSKGKCILYIYFLGAINFTYLDQVSEGIENNLKKISPKGSRSKMSLMISWDRVFQPFSLEGTQYKIKNV